MNAASGGEASGPGMSRARPTPRCQAIRLRLDIAVDRIVTPEVASELSECPVCDGCIFITLDEAGHIADIEPVEGRPSFRETCRLSIGEAIMDRFQHPV